MHAMTSRERFQRMYAHQEADRIPIVDSPWGATIERWQREGMPADVHYADYFGLDRTGHIGVDNSPRYPERLVAETDAYTVRTSKWGVTQRTWKHAASTPEFLAFTVVDCASWEQAKARMTPSDDRINWEYLRNHYPRWREQGWWIGAGLWFGFDVTHSWFVGTERLLCALLDDPDWCRDMFAHELELNLALLDRVWDAGYRFDSVGWPDDLGYKGSQFFSLALYREVLKPYHQRAIDWAHAKGVKVWLHSCGDVRPFVPEWVAMGVDALNPLEVKAGMDPLAIKRKFGDRLVLNGGVNAVLWDHPAAICAEMERVIPALKAGGGYIFSSDHSVPSSVSLNDFRDIVALAKRLGSY